MFLITLGTAGFLLAATVLLFIFQRSLMYFPMEYEEEVKDNLPPYVAPVLYDTPCGRQMSFYRQPANGDETPERLWIFLGGNAFRSLLWLNFPELFADEEAGYFLMEYPGYGFCEGKPSRENIIESMESAFDSLGKHLGMKESEMATDLNLLGHSLGCATSLEFASRHPVKKVILLAPFTSALDAARSMVPPPWHYLLIDRFDNMTRLSELAARENPPSVYIFHGTADRILSHKMGKRLSESEPEITEFHSYEGVGHNEVIEVAIPEIRKILNDASSSGRQDN